MKLEAVLEFIAQLGRSALADVDKAVAERRPVLARELHETTLDIVGRALKKGVYIRDLVLRSTRDDTEEKVSVYDGYDEEGFYSKIVDTIVSGYDIVAWSYGTSEKRKYSIRIEDDYLLKDVADPRYDKKRVSELFKFYDLDDAISENDFRVLFDILLDLVR